MAQHVGTDRASPDPHRCPDCRTFLVNRAGVISCPRCGFAATDPQAGAIWQLDVEAAALLARRSEWIAEIRRIDGRIAGVGQARALLVATMRAERAARAGVPPASGTGTGTRTAHGVPTGPTAPRPATAGPVPAAAPGTPRRRLSAQVLLVGLGAFLVVVAGVIFAAVAWERLGAVGQGSILVGATALAAALTVLAARARLIATAEALAVVTAGFAVVDIHAARLVAGPGSDPRTVWAIGLVVVAVGLAALARVCRLRVPGVGALVAAQPPLVLLGSLAAESSLGAGTGLLVLALVDYAAARRQVRVPTEWLPGVGVPLLRVLGSVAWAWAWFPAASAAIGPAANAGLHVWGLALMLLATTQLVALTLAVARLGLTSRAEGYAAVLAGVAVFDVLGLRVLVSSSGRGELVWAVGLAVVAAGLGALARGTRLQGPFVAAAVLAQAPLILVATGTARYVPGLADASGTRMAAAVALVLVALLDFLAARRLTPMHRGWVPGFAPSLLRGVGVLTWACGAALGFAQAFAPAMEDAAGRRWWAVGILLAGSAEAALLSRARTARSRIRDTAAAGSVLLSLAAVAASLIGFNLALHGLLLASTISALVIAAAPIAQVRRGVPSADSRVRAGQGIAVVWAVGWLLPWVPTWIAALAAPLVAVDDVGFWSREPGVTTGVARLGGVLAEAAGSTAFARAAVAAVLLAVATVLVARRTGAFAPVGRAPDAWSGIAAGILGGHLVLTMVAMGWDLPVPVVIAFYLLGAAACVWAAVRPDRPLRPWLAVAAAPFALSALAWAALLDQFTVGTLGVITVLAGALVVRGLSATDGAVTDAATAVAGAAMTAGGFTAALLAGMPAAHALVVALGVAAACSGLAWLADARAPWWTPAVELTTGALVLGSLVGLAVGGWADPFSVGLGVIIVTAAAHALRPARRALAGWTAAVVAVLLLWLRLQIADVRAVEPYSVPAAGLLLFAGGQQMRRRAGLGSWPALGPGLLVAAVPSVVVAVVGDETVRPLLVLVVAVAVTIVGAQVRMRAPLVVGASATAVVAFDQVFPVVAALPRWVILGSAGVLLLMVGARFEQRRRQAVHLYRVYSELR